MATYHLHIRATITVPDSAVINPNNRGWILEDGTVIKPFVVLEMNEEKDLSFHEANKLGLSVDNDEISAVVLTL